MEPADGLRMRAVAAERQASSVAAFAQEWGQGMGSQGIRSGLTFGYSYQLFSYCHEFFSQGGV